MTPTEALRIVALIAMVLGVLMFSDTPFLTLGQKFLLHRWRERIVLLGTELNFLALWAIARVYLGWDRALVRAPFELALATPGLALLLGGGALALWAKLRLGRWFSATFGVKPGHELVTDGPYAITRHPIYTGLVVALLGVALVWNSLLTVMLSVAMIVPFYFHTAIEEALFEQHFGAAYRDYRNRVPRLSPFPRPRHA